MQTVAAISTPPGKGGVAVIRISGDEALGIAERVFSPKGKTMPKSAPRMQIYGDILYRGEVIDDGLLTYFPAPNSFTGEDVIEISCHGGILVSRKVLESCFIEGASAAGAGEFTKRAFMSGKLSLSETEAIASLLEAKSDAQIMLARGSSRSKLTLSIDRISEKITSLLSSIWARIDYPDEDLGELSAGEIRLSIGEISRELNSLIATYRTGRSIAEGVRAVISGKPNAGKSTLYNLLLGEEAAIVTDVAGTTTDVLERTIPLGKVLLRLYDTAGIRSEASGKIEEIGIERSREKLSEADLVLMLIDAADGISGEDREIISFVKALSAPKIAIITKSELSDKDTVSAISEELSASGFENILAISAKDDPEGTIAALTERVEALFTDGELSVGDDAIVFSARQNAALIKAREHIEAAADAYDKGLFEDAASSELELALGAISELDGRAVSERVIADIFSKFCVGK